jgi:hypothetical protein
LFGVFVKASTLLLQFLSHFNKIDSSYLEMPRAAESTIQLGDRADDYNDWLEDQQEEDDFDELERQRDGPSDATALLLNGKSTTTNAADAKDDDKKKDGVEKKPRKNIVRVNLDAKRLCGVVAPDTPATGLPTLVKDFADVKWLGSGHEVGLLKHFLPQSLGKTDTGRRRQTSRRLID